MKLQKGFTLIEVLIYASILAITAGLLTAVLTNTVRIKSREANSTELSQQLNFVLGTVQSLVNESANIESVYETGFPGTACSDFCRAEAYSSESLRGSRRAKSIGPIRRVSSP